MGEVAQVLRATLEQMGPNGERWNPDGWQIVDDRRCIVMTIRHLAGGYQTCSELFALENAAVEVIAGEAGVPLQTDDGASGVGTWNDDPNTTWEDVRLVLKRALARAEEEGL